MTDEIFVIAWIVSGLINLIVVIPSYLNGKKITGRTPKPSEWGAIYILSVICVSLSPFVFSFLVFIFTYALLSGSFDKQDENTIDKSYYRTKLDD